jgi:outer membrane protein assembly factor BamE (lipoprotein component of BamABCDE complex)
MRTIMNKAWNLMLLPVVTALLFLVLVISGCDRNVLSASKLTAANYNQISSGMTKAQVEKILGAPTSIETKDMLLFKTTSYRYEEGKKFALITFRNDEVVERQGNLNQ